MEETRSRHLNERQKKRRIRRRAAVLAIQQNLIPVSPDLPLKYFNPYGEIVWKHREIYKGISRLAKKHMETVPNRRVNVFQIPHSELPKHLKFGEESLINEVIHLTSGSHNLEWQKDWRRVHLALGSMEILSQIGSKITILSLKRRESVELINYQKELRPRQIRLRNAPTTIMIERMNTRIIGFIKEIVNFANDTDKGATTFKPHISGQIPTLDNIQYQGPAPISKQPISFIRADLSIAEIQRRILFLDCEFVIGYKEMVGQKMRHTLLLASVAILNYEGEILLNTRVTPTKKVWRYHPSITGFTARSLRNQRKEAEVKREIKELVRDRILVGHDLSSDLKVLEIDLNQLCGIRDLSTSLVLKEIMGTDKPRLKLADVAEKLLNQTLRTTIDKDGTMTNVCHSALEDVLVISSIYKKIENNYIDDI